MSHLAFMCLGGVFGCFRVIPVSFSFSVEDNSKIHHTNTTNKTEET